MSEEARGRLAAAKLRVGVLLWLLSWTPIPILLGLQGSARYAVWGIQFFVGLLGLALAGSAFVDAVKELGWKRAPAALGRALVHGDTQPAVSA